MGFFNNIIPEHSITITDNGEKLYRYENGKWVKKQGRKHSLINPISDNEGNQYYYGTSDTLPFVDHDVKWRKCSPLFNVARKVFANTIASDLVPVQPMSSQLSEVTYMDFPYASGKIK